MHVVAFLHDGSRACLTQYRRPGRNHACVAAAACCCGGLLQVYVDGVLFAAVLDDVVMQPLTGKLMAVLYRYYTPGGLAWCRATAVLYHTLLK